MYEWFFASVLFIFVAVIFHFKSVEYSKLEEQYGEEKGAKIGKIYGNISGTIESVALVWFWLSPQPRFTMPILYDLAFSLFNFTVPLSHLVISLPIIALGCWAGIRGVLKTGLKASETHRKPEKIVNTGVYSIVRHPQYLGWILAHIGFSVFFSATLSVFFSPVLITLIYLISRKEEPSW